jgi:transposase
MAHGINANVVHRWRQLVREGGVRRMRPSTRQVTAGATSFVPVVVGDAPADAKAEEIHIELRRGATALAVRWPVSAATQCAVWLRELLQ